jgi:2-amino-4-hydroxy-6-hydroxymethyldihydropteridine diphosphokinase
MSPQLPGRGKILVALGANFPGPWGTPTETITRALRELETVGTRIERVSNFYETAAVGPARQPSYVNAVALLDTSLPAPALLRVLKTIERRAGRRGGRPWGPRTLDLDIIDYKGVVSHWDARQGDFAGAGARPLVLPHPLAHTRPFVLAPLLDVAPGWRHPVLKRSARELWREIAGGVEGRVIRKL